ncbi:hypothetical protein OIU74_015860 [Salix koriyanagi]|uniref:Uncharacterized protein n=1 Tax=Salix koriyanagi TaxID=2511006 RepID=A0A9Q0SV70_9ROSI|nr:hypothetical protein OIU74_015860 [Salix koriyanagi]
MNILLLQCSNRFFLKILLQLALRDSSDFTKHHSPRSSASSSVDDSTKSSSSSSSIITPLNRSSDGFCNFLLLEKLQPWTHQHYPGPLHLNRDFLFAIVAPKLSSNSTSSTPPWFPSSRSNRNLFQQIQL